MQTPERCNCGSEDCLRCYPLNRQACKISDNDRADALELIVEEVLDDGKYPQQGRTEIDLYEFLTEELDSSFAYELVVAALGKNNQALGHRIERLYDNVQAMLKQHLSDSDCVEELAQEMADDRGQI